MAVNEYWLSLEPDRLELVPGFETLDTIDKVLAAGLLIVGAQSHPYLHEVGPIFDSVPGFIIVNEVERDTLGLTRTLLSTITGLMKYEEGDEGLIAKPNTLSQIWDVLMAAHAWEPTIGTFITYDSTQRQLWIQFAPEDQRPYVLQYVEEGLKAYWREDEKASKGPFAYENAKRDYGEAKARYVREEGERRLAHQKLVEAAKILREAERTKDTEAFDRHLSKAIIESEKLLTHERDDDDER